MRVLTFPLPVYLVLLLQVSCFNVKGQAGRGTDTAVTYAGGAIRKIGFGSEMVLVDKPSFAIDRIGHFSKLSFQLPLTYDSFQNTLLHSPQGHDFWIDFTLRNNSADTLTVNVYCGTMNYIDLTMMPPGMPRQHFSGGNLRPPMPGTSLIQQQFHILPIRLPPHLPTYVLICLRQQTRSFDFDGLTLYSPGALGTAFSKDFEEEHDLFVFQWLFQGFLLCQVFFVLFQWLIIRRKEYLYYLFYVTAIGLYFLSKFESDLGLSLLFTRWPILAVYLNKTLLILPYWLYFRFTRSFLDIPANYPELNQWMVMTERFLLVYMVADLGFILFTSDQVLQAHVFTIVLPIVFVFAAAYIIYLFRRGQALINYILTGSLFVAVGNILGQVFTYFQDYHSLSLVPNILVFPQVGVLLEMLCFTAGLGYKSYMAEREKIQGQQRLIEQLKANELLQARMQHIRNKIAQDLHDDIGSTLSSISILSDLALRGETSGPTYVTMNEIKDSSMLLMERMDDIVWSINPRNDSLDNLLMRVRHFATTLFEAKGIDYTIHIQKEMQAVRLPMDYRQHIYLILKEAINNLVKYAQASQAHIEVRHDQRFLRLSVRDNGRGFDLSCPVTGHGLSGMRHRAQLMEALLDIRSAPGEGTEIELRVDIG